MNQTGTCNSDGGNQAIRRRVVHTMVITRVESILVYLSSAMSYYFLVGLRCENILRQTLHWRDKGQETGKKKHSQCGWGGGHTQKEPEHCVNGYLKKNTLAFISSALNLP